MRAPNALTRGAKSFALQRNARSRRVPGPSPIGTRRHAKSTTPAGFLYTEMKSLEVAAEKMIRLQ
jgi:hypothetical protein